MIFRKIQSLFRIILRFWRSGTI